MGNKWRGAWLALSTWHVYFLIVYVAFFVFEEARGADTIALFNRGRI